MKKIVRILLVAIGMLMASGATIQAQVVGLKTNLLSDIALSPSLGVEIGLAPKWSLDLSGQINAWTLKRNGRDHKWKHVLVQPEARYWFCQRFAGHFVGLHAIGGIYNVGNLNIPMDFLGFNLRVLKDKRFQGWTAGAGVAYGYAWPVHKHWNIEAEIGVGWMYTRFDEYPCLPCGNAIKEDVVRNYVGPTKLAVNVEYLF